MRKSGSLSCVLKAGCRPICLFTPLLTHSGASPHPQRPIGHLIFCYYLLTKSRRPPQLDPSVAPPCRVNRSEPPGALTHRHKQRYEKMTFPDFVIDTRLRNHNGEELTHELDTVAQQSKSMLSQLGARYLAKERFQERDEIDNDPSRSHFFHEFPRKQSNNDLQYHTDDIVINFLVHWFFMKGPKGKDH